MPDHDARPSDAMGLRERLRADLTAAMKRRDRPAVTVIRTLLGAIANSEAVAVPDGPYDPAVGLGGDVSRRDLAEADLVAIVAAEIERHRIGAGAAEAAGRDERAAQLRTELDVLVRYRVHD